MGVRYLHYLEGRNNAVVKAQLLSLELGQNVLGNEDGKQVSQLLHCDYLPLKVINFVRHFTSI